VKEIVPGTLEGGRVVGVVAGLFAGLPPALRETRRRGDKGILVAVSGSDPLNLAGILTPGPRIAALTGNRVLYRDGVPVAALTAGEVSFLGGNSTRPPNGRHVRCCCARCGLPRLRRSWTMSTLSHCFIRNGLTRKLRARYVGGRNSPLSGFQEQDQRSGSSSLQSKHLNFGPFAPILTKRIGWRHFGQSGLASSPDMVMLGSSSAPFRKPVRRRHSSSGRRRTNSRVYDARQCDRRRKMPDTAYDRATPS
jgi:hypothetical protein